MLHVAYCTVHVASQSCNRRGPARFHSALAQREKRALAVRADPKIGCTDCCVASMRLATCSDAMCRVQRATWRIARRGRPTEPKKSGGKEPSDLASTEASLRQLKAAAQTEWFETVKDMIPSPQRYTLGDANGRGKPAAAAASGELRSSMETIAGLEALLEHQHEQLVAQGYFPGTSSLQERLLLSKVEEEMELEALASTPPSFSLLHQRAADGGSLLHPASMRTSQSGAGMTKLSEPTYGFASFGSLGFHSLSLPQRGTALDGGNAAERTLEDMSSWLLEVRPPALRDSVYTYARARACAVR